jgi:hypothetical protein
MTAIGSAARRMMRAATPKQMNTSSRMVPSLEEREVSASLEIAPACGQKNLSDPGARLVEIRGLRR